jgi:hypothetical protein
MGDVSEFYVETETTVNQSTKNVEYVPSPASLKTVSETEDADDNVPILGALGLALIDAETCKAKLTAMGSTLPLTKPAHLSKEEWWEMVLKSEQERLQRLGEARLVPVEKMCLDAGSSDDDVPIVRTLQGASEKARKKEKS